METVLVANERVSCSFMAIIDDFQDFYSILYFCLFLYDFVCEIVEQSIIAGEHRSFFYYV